MSDYAYIPLNTAAEPRISDRKIAKANNIVVIEEVFTRLFIDEFPKSASECRQNLRIKAIILQDNNRNI